MWNQQSCRTLSCFKTVYYDCFTFNCLANSLFNTQMFTSIPLKHSCEESSITFSNVCLVIEILIWKCFESIMKLVLVLLQFWIWIFWSSPGLPFFSSYMLTFHICFSSYLFSCTSSNIPFCGSICMEGWLLVPWYIIN